MPEFIKKILKAYRVEKMSGKFLDLEGLTYLVSKLNTPVCDKLLSETSKSDWTSVTLSKSMSKYKYLTVAMIFGGAVRDIENIPVPIVKQRNSEQKCIRVSCPTDYGDMSVGIYYVSDTEVKIKTSIVNVELYGMI